MEIYNRYIIRNLTNEKIMKILMFFLYLLAFSLPISEAFKQISIAGIVVSGAILIHLQKLKINKDTMFFGATILLVSSYIPILYANDINAVLHGATDLLKIFAIFFILREISIDNKHILTFFSILFLSFIGSALLAEYQYLTGVRKYFELKSIGHVNHTALYTSIIFFISYGIYFFYKDNNNIHFKKITYLALLTLLISVSAMVIEGSRGVWVATFIPLILTVLFHKQYKRKSFQFFIITIILLVVFVIFSNDYTMHKIKEGIFYTSGRTEIWRASLDAFLENNIFFGIGSGNFHFIDLKAYGSTFGKQYISHAHNTYINFLIEKGIMGLIGYLIFTVALFLKLVKRFERDYLGIIAFNVLILNIVISLVNTSFHHENALLMAIVWAIALQHERSKKIDKAFSL